MNAFVRSARLRSRWPAGPLARRPAKPLIVLAVLASGPLPACAASALTTNLPALTSELPGAGVSMLRVFGALALVLAIFLGGVWGFKNWQRLAIRRAGRQPHLQLLEMKSLGARHALYVVGYQHQRMLLASSPAGITLVSHLPVAEPGPGETIPIDPPSSGPRFSETLQQMLQRKA